VEIVDITRVQRWVASSLTLTVAYVWAGGMVILALSSGFDQTRESAQIMIFVMAGIIGVGAIVGVRLINALPWTTPWLLVGLLPTAVGLWVLSQR
jgi:hypothetical protein